MTDSSSQDVDEARVRADPTSHEDIEPLLPVTSWRGWLVAACGLMLVVAALLYAASSSRYVTVSGIGRATAPEGITLVTATVAGQMDDITVAPGAKVGKDQVLAYITAGDQRVAQRAPSAGTVVGIGPRPGDPVAVGDWLFELATTDTDGRSVYAAFPEDVGAQIAPGQRATLTIIASLQDGDARASGTVEGVVKDRTERPLDAKSVQTGLALPDQPDGNQVVALIEPAEPIAPGAVVMVEVVVQERNLLQQLLGRS